MRRLDEENPVAGQTARGERWKPIRRYSAALKNSEGDGNLTGADPGAGDCARVMRHES
jgi:hypothetical protein